MKSLACMAVAALYSCAASGPVRTPRKQYPPETNRDAGAFTADAVEEAGLPNDRVAAARDAGLGADVSRDADADASAATPDAGAPCCNEFPPEDPPPPDDPPPVRDCVDFLVRSPAPWILELASLYLCEAPCAVLLGEPIEAGGWPWGWIWGPVTPHGEDSYRWDLSVALPGTYRFSYAAAEDCDAEIGLVLPGGVCDEAGVWAAYGDGRVLCPETAHWIWCGETPEDGYTCSLVMQILPDGTILPAGNR